LIPLEMILVVSAALLGFIAVSQLVGRRVLMLIKRTGGGLSARLSGTHNPLVNRLDPYVGWIIKVLAVVLDWAG